MSKCEFAVKGCGTAKSFATIWYVGSLTAIPELLPGDARVASAHVRSFLASVVGEWLPLWGALWSFGDLWACPW